MVVQDENYRLVYELEGATAWILTLVHTSHLWPPEFDVGHGAVRVKVCFGYVTMKVSGLAALGGAGLTDSG